MSKSKIKAALEDAGYENIEVSYSKKAPNKGYAYDTGDTGGFLGVTAKAALAFISAMPNPNLVEMTKVPKAGEETTLEADDFGNPIHSAF